MAMISLIENTDGILKLINMNPWPFVSKMISRTHGAYFWNDLIAYLSWFISRNRDGSVSDAFWGSFSYNCSRNFGSVPFTQVITTSIGSSRGLQSFFWAYGGLKSNGISGIRVTLTKAGITLPLNGPTAGWSHRVCLTDLNLASWSVRNLVNPGLY